jgi:hypothetical protein
MYLLIKLQLVIPIFVIQIPHPNAQSFVTPMHNLDIPMHNLSYNIRYLKIFNQGHAHVTV